MHDINNSKPDNATSAAARYRCVAIVVNRLLEQAVYSRPRQLESALSRTAHRCEIRYDVEYGSLTNTSMDKATPLKRFAHLQ